MGNARIETTHFKKRLPLPPYYLILFFATGTVIILHVCEKKCHEPFVTTPGGTEGTTLHMVELAVRLWTFPTTQSSQTSIMEGLTTVSSIGKRVIIRLHNKQFGSPKIKSPGSTAEYPPIAFFLFSRLKMLRIFCISFTFWGIKIASTNQR